MKNLFYSLYLFLACSLIQCSISKPIISPPDLFLKNYTFNATPNNSDEVGYVFALDNNKVPQPITMLQLKVRDGVIVLPASTSSSTLSYGAMLHFLGVKNLDVEVKDSIGNKRKITTNIAFENPTHSRAFLVNVDSVLLTKKEEISRAIVNEGLKDAPLFLIIETIKAKKITYDFTKSNIGKDTLNSNFFKIAKLNGNVNWNNDGKYNLTFVSPTPLTIFYKLKSIQVLESATGTPVYRTGKDILKTEL